MIPIDEIYEGWYWVTAINGTQTRKTPFCAEVIHYHRGLEISSWWSENLEDHNFISRVLTSEETKRSRNALEFYAKRENHRIRVDAHGKILQDSECFMDFGKRAKEALKETKREDKNENY